MQSVSMSKLAALNSYAKRQNNQQLYCWLPDSIYADYGNSGKQAYKNYPFIFLTFYQYHLCLRPHSATSVSNWSNLKSNQFETEGTQNWSGISFRSLVTSVTYFGTIRTCVIAMWASWSSCSMTSTLNSGDDKHVFGLLPNSRTLHNCILITSLSLVS